MSNGSPTYTETVQEFIQRGDTHNALHAEERAELAKNREADRDRLISIEATQRHHAETVNEIKADVKAVLGQFKMLPCGADAIRISAIETRQESFKTVLNRTWWALGLMLGTVIATAAAVAALAPQISAAPEQIMTHVAP